MTKLSICVYMCAAVKVHKHHVVRRTFLMKVTLVCLTKSPIMGMSRFRLPQEIKCVDTDLKMSQIMRFASKVRVFMDV